jgi:hypothetical protein
MSKTIRIFYVMHAFVFQYDVSCVNKLNWCSYTTQIHNDTKENLIKEPTWLSLDQMKEISTGQVHAHLNILFQAQLKYNVCLLADLLRRSESPTSAKLLPLIYKNQDFWDAIDDVYGMDEVLQNSETYMLHHVIVLIHSISNSYLGHIYSFRFNHHHTSRLHVIGIRGRPDKFLPFHCIQEKNISFALLEAVRQFAQKCGCHDFAVVCPRDNMLPILKKLEFEAIECYPVSEETKGKKTLAPTILEKVERKTASDVFLSPSNQTNEAFFILPANHSIIDNRVTEIFMAPKSLICI